ncbi:MULTISPECIES: Lsr2 family protein [unclassified Streptomyces]|uniref:histone-like nucleoid-structuring protein Lsr2 n=1 Tax=unclassified Streptomyces TaxID=2593676 RepID=UPI0009A4BBCB|nr:Lsr2 family protein [Streptomyces sp. 3211]
MVQKHVTIYIDDLTGQETDEGAVHTFTLNGVNYEIDLSPDSYDRMLEAFGPFLKAGRKVGNKKRSAVAPQSHTVGPSTAQLREWAKEQGYDINDRGRIPVAIREAYDAAH